jgi:two-component system sensor histidine kinase BaeS
MILSLRVKLTAAFLCITMVLFVLIGVFVNLILDKQFKEYVVEKQDKKNAEIVNTLESRYLDWGNQWDTSGLESLGVGALGDSLMLRVTSADGTILWDAMKHNSGMCASILENMSDNMQGRSSGGYEEQSFPIVSGGKKVGTVHIGYYGPYYYTDSDIRFLNTLNELLLAAAVVAAIIYIVLGAYMAKRLSSPISRVIRTAGQISKGNYDDRVDEKSSTKEIVELTDAINTLAQTLEKQETLRKRMTADVAHELRTPTANLQSHLEAMIDGIWKPDTDRLKSCHEETERISKMVSDLENLARAESGHLIIKKEQFDLSLLLQKVTQSFENEFHGKNIRLIMNSETRNIQADPHMVEQIVVNLLSNALKYTPDGGTIQVGTAKRDDAIEISIKDSGIGISPEDLPNIFERFYRVDSSRSRATGGSGIGLSIVKSLVDTMKGSIQVTSQLDTGSEFVVTLPS